MNHYALLDVDRIEDARKDCRVGRQVVVFRSTDSTNDIAWEYAANANNDGLCVLAESQHKGRGRRGRQWYSESGQSVLCSVLLTKTAAAAEILTLTAGVAVAEAINDTAWAASVPQTKTPSGLRGTPPSQGESCLDRATRLQCRIKWPNDILIQNKKVAGVLVEKRIENDLPCFVIGIGINCNQQSKAFEHHTLNLPATSLAIETGRPIDRTGFVIELLKQIEVWLSKTNEQIVERWLELSGMLGEHVAVECDGRRYSGFCRGVDPVEGLILQLDNSLVRMFGAAQTSIVPSRGDVDS